MYKYLIFFSKVKSAFPGIESDSQDSAETKRFELLKAFTPYLVSSEAHSTGLCDVSKYRCEFTGNNYPLSTFGIGVIIGNSSGALSQAGRSQRRWLKMPRSKQDPLPLADCLLSAPSHYLKR